MKKFPFGFAVVLLVVTAALGAVVFMQKKPIAPAYVAPDTTAVSTSYVISMHDIVTEYRASPTQTAARKAEARMLNLTVPTEHRDVHLDLVLALHRYGTMSAANAKSLAAAKDKVNAILDSANWLQ